MDHLTKKNRSLISEYDSILIILRYDQDGAPIQREG